ncbi:MAG TPA: hypothetical protein VFA55_05460, partial [Candidatus Kapabacteria bacterium]|nr:hypothetical protein [Candidatus Kapabacteria bacterium]
MWKYIKMRRANLVVVTIFVVCSAFAGCWAGEVVYEQPPLPRIEVLTAPPGPNYIWTRGYWEWHSQWVWIPGHWIERPYQRAVWLPSYWVHHYNGWRRVPGHW